MSDEHDLDAPDPSYTAIYDGVVVDRDDPMKIGRVRVMVPGLIEPKSDWAMPVATGGQRFYSVPKVGAEVSVWFKMGDPDGGLRYAAGAWSAPGGVPTSPTPVRDAQPADAPDITCIETDTFLVVLDDREGHREMRLVHKPSGDGVTYDGEVRALQITGTVLVKIVATGAVQIEGAAVTINGRPVSPGGGPI